LADGVERGWVELLGIVQAVALAIAIGIVRGAVYLARGDAGIVAA